MIQKLFTPFLLLIIFNQISFSQTNDLLKVETYKLDNGLTVFLNEDPTANKVFGAVMVNAGAKNESPNATGMAHYLEHMLFKGTETIGTSNYQLEKPHLDSINALYEKLGKTDAEEKRVNIQKLINEQALKASKYGLPNEFDKLLKSIGSTGVNAFTSSDMTFYHNSFPAHEITKWLDIYAHRFQNPVFRSFQSELEVVYEEKNRATDNMENRVFEEMNKQLFPNIPQGQWSVLGKTEHLKNPPLNKMYEFFHKNYVANNMALILSGNFSSEQVKPIIKLKFEQLKTAELQKLELPKLEAFDGKKIVKKRMTPVKVGFLGYQTAAQNHPDRLALDVCEYLLTNNSQTGFIDKLQLNNEMMYCGAFSLNYNDVGGFAIFYVPKILRQSLKNATSKAMSAIDNLKQGKFTDDMLLSAKNELNKHFKMRLENLRNRGTMIGTAFNQGVSWDDYLGYPEKINTISREEVIRVANKYFSENHLEFISKTGFPKNPKLDKPSYKAVKTDQNAVSDYAKHFEQLPSIAFKPRFLDFDKDIEQKTLEGGHQVWASRNPINDLFYLQIRFKTGKIKNPDLETAVKLINYSGAEKYSLSEIKQLYANLGCSYYFESSNNYVTIKLDGNDESLEKCLALTNLLLQNPIANENSKKILLNEIKTDIKINKNDPNYLGRALYSYGIYGKRSTYLKRNSLSEIEKMSIEKMLGNYKDVVSNYQAEIIYTGNKPIGEFSELLSKNLSLSKKEKADDYIFRDSEQRTKNIIYLVNDKKAIQSQIYFFVEGEIPKTEQFASIKAFTEYFGGGFSGLVMQEIREYRSLAYATYGAYQTMPLANKNGRLVGYIGCQADKSTEAVATMFDLITKMPIKEGRMETLKKNLQLKVITNFPDSKQIPFSVLDYQRLGFKEDPYKAAYKQYPNLKMDDIVDFYKQTIQNKPIVITIYGDKKRMDLKKLSQFGEIIELQLKDFVVF